MLEPIYPLTAGLSGKVVVKAVRQALNLCIDRRSIQEFIYGRTAVATSEASRC